MRRATLMTTVVLAAAVGPGSAHAAPHHGGGQGSSGEPAAAAGSHAVAIANRAFAPGRVTALEGDTVEWRNEDFLVHNVSAAGGAIFSGALSRDGRFSHRFTETGPYPYLCTLHPFMTGRVDVHAALLQGPSSPVLAGHEVALHGRTAAGAAVAIEQQPAGAPGFTAVSSTHADAAGGFHGTVRPQATTTYRAVSPRGASPAVTVTVAERLQVRLTARRARGVTRVRVSAPGAGGAKATLQLYSRERFTWLDRRRGRLDAAGRATFRLRARLRYHARVVITTADGTVLGSSRSVKLPR